MPRRCLGANQADIAEQTYDVWLEPYPELAADIKRAPATQNERNAQLNDQTRTKLLQHLDHTNTDTIEDRPLSTAVSGLTYSIRPLSVKANAAGDSSLPSKGQGIVIEIESSTANEQ